MTTPAFRAISTATNAFAMSVTVAAPASTQEGDLLLFLIAYVGGSAATPAGWTALGTEVAFDGTYYNVQSAYYRFAEAGDAGANFTFTTSGGDTSYAAAIAAYSDVQSVAGFEEFASTVSAASIAADPVAVGQALTRTVATFSCTTATTITHPGTSRANFSSSGAWSPQLQFSIGDDTNDPNTTRTATLGSSINRRTAFTIVLRGGSVVKVWNGSAWVEKPLYRWDGSAWVATVLKRWNGSAWEAT